ncbi:hypothetical protein B0J14DRAFT_707764 [Halenospora varia]|nr:hypothetical protein B0J14DRAFT_707764 [Halenospora varia]
MSMANQMYFIKDLPLYKEEKPFAIDQLLPNADFPITNIEYEKHEIQVHDIRDDESKPKFDTHSFCYVNHPSKFSHLKTEEEMMWPYAKETTDLLKEKFGTDRAICFDLRWRRNQTFTEEELVSSDRSIPTPTVHEAHLDATPASGFDRIRNYLSQEEATEYLSGRWRARIINCWRPLFRTIQDSPLAFCDPSTVDPVDLLSTDRVAPGSYLEIYSVRYNPGQKWYWLSEQRVDEMAVFVVYDSHPPKGKLNFTPHSAFINGSAPEGSPPRQSVETRTLIFTPVVGGGEMFGGKKVGGQKKRQPWKEHVDVRMERTIGSKLTGDVRLLETG